MGQYGKLKPGYLTSEFWITILSSVSGILVALEVVSVEQLDSVWGIVMAIGSGLGYSISRGIAKSNPNSVRG